MTQLTCTGAGRSAGGSGAFVGAYDAIANLAHVYEPARCTLSAYSGSPLVRLRRASDDAEADFSHVSAANPELDTAAIAAWAGGAAYVVTVYDQKGNKNFTNAISGTQPAYVESAQNGHAGMQFGSKVLSTAFTESTPYTIMTVARMNPLGSGNRRIFRLNPGILDFWAQLTFNYMEVSGKITGALALNSNCMLWTGVFINGTSVFRLNQNQTTRDILSRSLSTAYLGGANATPADSWPGTIDMLLISTAELTGADLLAAEAAINSYWAVY